MKAGTSYIDEVKYRKMLGVYIKEQRVNFGWDHRELSKQTGINSRHLKRIEAGEVSVRVTTLEKLKGPLALDGPYLDKIQDVARIAFINDLIQLLNANPEVKNDQQ